VYKKTFMALLSLICFQLQGADIASRLAARARAHQIYPLETSSHKVAPELLPPAASSYSKPSRILPIAPLTRPAVHNYDGGNTRPLWMSINGYPLNDAAKKLEAQSFGRGYEQARQAREVAPEGYPMCKAEIAAQHDAFVARFNAEERRVIEEKNV
jgi:hypothetical protein